MTHLTSCGRVRARRPARRARGVLQLIATGLAIGALAFAAAPARADVVAEGDVSPAQDPDLPIDGGTVAGPLIVGGTGDNNVIPVGRLVIDVPAFTDPLTADDVIIGDAFEGVGETTVTGFGSELRVVNILTVGNEGIGYLNVTSGARVTTNYAGTTTPGSGNDDFILGQEAASQGYVNVSGFGSGLNMSKLLVGVNGFGRIELFDRAQMNTTEEASLGDDAGILQNEIGTGYVLLDGRGTRWNVGDVGGNGPTSGTGDLTIGRRGRGTVEIRNQAVVAVERDIMLGDVTFSGVTSYGQAYVTGVDSKLWAFERLLVGSTSTPAALGALYLVDRGAARADVSTTITPNSLVQMSTGGILLSPTITNNGIIRGDGRLEGNVTNNGQIRNAALTANIREKLWVTGDVNNTGDLESIGGEMEFIGTFNNNGPNADIVAKDAILRFNGGLNNTGNTFLDNTLVWTPGTFASNAALVVAASTSVLAGDGDLVLQDNNSLFVTIGQQFSRLELTGGAQLDGDVLISLGQSYIPKAGDKFEIIEAQNVAGVFDNVIGPLISGFSFTATYLAQSVIINVGAGFVFNADFNGDKIVDAADLTILRNNFGAMMVPPNLGDANGDGNVDGGDFRIWQQQLGMTFPIAAATGAVPEPSTIVMALAAVAIPLRRRRPPQRSEHSALA